MLAHIALYATLVLVIQSPTTSPNTTKEKAPPPCTVSGRVVTAADGSSLKSARVILMPDKHGETWKQPQVYSALSETDGRFTIKNVPAGRYRFSAKHTGYVDQPYQSSGADAGAVLALQAGQEVRDVIFRMTLAAVITGKVSDEDGEPMAGIQVVALHRPRGRISGTSVVPEPSGIKRRSRSTDGRQRPISSIRTQAGRILHSRRGPV